MNLRTSVYDDSWERKRHDDRGTVGVVLIGCGMFAAAFGVAAGETGFLVGGAAALGTGIIVFTGSGERSMFGGGGRDSSGGLSGDSSGGSSGCSGGDSGSSSGGGCIIAGTLVVLGDGATKPIETVEVGDYVVSRDETTGNTNPQRVSRTFIHQLPATLLLYSMNDEQVETTGEHRFSVPDQGFIGARRLTPGVTLDIQREQRVKVTGIEARLQSACVGSAAAGIRERRETDADDVMSCGN